jgi:hypothetical protein
LSASLPSGTGNPARAVLRLRRRVFLRRPYLRFPLGEARKANFKTQISPALIPKKHAAIIPQLTPNKRLSVIAAARLWIPVEIVNLLLTYSRLRRILLGLWTYLSARQGGSAL